MERIPLYQLTDRKQNRRLLTREGRPSGRRPLLAVLIALLVCMPLLAVALLMSGAQPDDAVPAASVAESGVPAEGTSENPVIVIVSASPEPKEFRQPDDVLLTLVNADTAVPENWKLDLREIDGDTRIDARAYEDLMAMITAAEKDGVCLWVASGYRSEKDQEVILERGVRRRMDEQGMTRTEATENALRTIQQPGFSEHHLGLAVDLNDVSDCFEETDEYRWLSVHAAEYGFVQRYRRDKVEFTGIDNESWHYRYVGPGNARDMVRLDMCLEEYVEYRNRSGK